MSSIEVAAACSSSHPDGGGGWGTCGICLSDYDAGTASVGWMKCGHYFCFECLMPWAGKEANTCPSCSKRITAVTKTTAQLARAAAATASAPQGEAIKVSERKFHFVPSAAEYAENDAVVACLENCLLRSHYNGNIDAAQFSLQCDLCKQWFHCVCVKIKIDSGDQGIWTCPPCMGEVVTTEDMLVTAGVPREIAAKGVAAATAYYYPSYSPTGACTTGEVHRALAHVTSTTGSRFRGSANNPFASRPMGTRVTRDLASSIARLHEFGSKVEFSSYSSFQRPEAATGSAYGAGDSEESHAATPAVETAAVSHKRGAAAAARSAVSSKLGRGARGGLASMSSPLLAAPTLYPTSADAAIAAADSRMKVQCVRSEPAVAAPTGKGRGSSSSLSSAMAGLSAESRALAQAWDAWDVGRLPDLTMIPPPPRVLFSAAHTAEDNCHVCATGESVDENKIIFCDGCDVAVHQACYGVAEVPQGEWYCKVCATGRRPSAAAPPPCVFCPCLGGAMTRTNDGRWCHGLCARWFVDCDYDAKSTVDLVCSKQPLGAVPAGSSLGAASSAKGGAKVRTNMRLDCEERDEARSGPLTEFFEHKRMVMKCSLCGTANGAVIQCISESCCVAFHPMCGALCGCYMRFEASWESPINGWESVAYCQTHTAYWAASAANSDERARRGMHGYVDAIPEAAVDDATAAAGANDDSCAVVGPSIVSLPPGSASASHLHSSPVGDDVPMEERESMVAVGASLEVMWPCGVSPAIWTRARSIRDKDSVLIPAVGVDAAPQPLSAGPSGVPLWLRAKVINTLADHLQHSAVLYHVTRTVEWLPILTQASAAWVRPVSTNSMSKSRAGGSSGTNAVASTSSVLTAAQPAAAAMSSVEQGRLVFAKSAIGSVGVEHAAFFSANGSFAAAAASSSNVGAGTGKTAEFIRSPIAVAAAAPRIQRTRVSFANIPRLTAATSTSSFCLGSEPPSGTGGCGDALDSCANIFKPALLIEPSEPTEISWRPAPDDDDDDEVEEDGLPHHLAAAGPAPLADSVLPREPVLALHTEVEPAEIEVGSAAIEAEPAEIAQPLHEPAIAFHAEPAGMAPLSPHGLALPFEAVAIDRFTAVLMQPNTAVVAVVVSARLCSACNTMNPSGRAHCRMCCRRLLPPKAVGNLAYTAGLSNLVVYKLAPTASEVISGAAPPLEPAAAGTADAVLRRLQGAPIVRVAAASSAPMAPEASFWSTNAPLFCERNPAHERPTNGSLRAGPRPASTVAEARPASTVAEARPASTVAEARPVSTVAEARPASQQAAIGVLTAEPRREASAAAAAAGSAPAAAALVAAIRVPAAAVGTAGSAIPKKKKAEAGVPAAAALLSPAASRAGALPLLPFPSPRSGADVSPSIGAKRSREPEKTAAARTPSASVSTAAAGPGGALVPRIPRREQQPAPGPQLSHRRDGGRRAAADSESSSDGYVSSDDDRRGKRARTAKGSGEAARGAAQQQQQQLTVVAAAAAASIAGATASAIAAAVAPLSGKAVPAAAQHIIPRKAEPPSAAPPAASAAAPAVASRKVPVPAAAPSRLEFIVLKKSATGAAASSAAAGAVAGSGSGAMGAAAPAASASSSAMPPPPPPKSAAAALADQVAAVCQLFYIPPRTRAAAVQLIAGALQYAYATAGASSSSSLAVPGPQRERSAGIGQLVERSLHRLALEARLQRSMAAAVTRTRDAAAAAAVSRGADAATAAFAAATVVPVSPRLMDAALAQRCHGEYRDHMVLVVAVMRERRFAALCVSALDGRTDVPTLVRALFQRWQAMQQQQQAAAAAAAAPAASSEPSPGSAGSRVSGAPARQPSSQQQQQQQQQASRPGAPAGAAARPLQSTAAAVAAKVAAAKRAEKRAKAAAAKAAKGGDSDEDASDTGGCAAAPFVGPAGAARPRRAVRDRDPAAGRDGVWEAAAALGPSRRLNPHRVRVMMRELDHADVRAWAPTGGAALPPLLQPLEEGEVADGEEEWDGDEEVEPGLEEEEEGDEPLYMRLPEARRGPVRSGGGSSRGGGGAPHAAAGSTAAPSSLLSGLVELEEGKEEQAPDAETLRSAAASPGPLGDEGGGLQSLMDSFDDIFFAAAAPAADAAAAAAAAAPGPAAVAEDSRSAAASAGAAGGAAAAIDWDELLGLGEYAADAAAGGTAGGAGGGGGGGLDPFALLLDGLAAGGPMDVDV